VKIYLIAGPPGVGKSTNGVDFIPVGTPVVDQDLAAYQYKKQGFADYQDLASLRTGQTIREHLFAYEDFAFELNLGFVSHYDYLRSLAAVNPANKIELILFFTDDITLCLNRAASRHRSGGHLVKPEVVEEMYRNTIPLLLANQILFDRVRLIDVNGTSVIEHERMVKDLPAWIVRNGLVMYLSEAKRTQKSRGRKPKL
jgi:predicted ABC-type ATPase